MIKILKTRFSIISLFHPTGLKHNELSAIIFKICILSSFILIIFQAETWAKSPHFLDQRTYNYNCKKCHLNNPYKTNGKLSREGPFDDICLSCHRLPNRLPLISCNRIVKKGITALLLEQIPDIALNIRDAKITCESCHRMHIKKGEQTLRGEYLFFLKQAERINPHKSNVFCTFCHEKEPRDKEDALNLKFDGDSVLICMQCHNNIIARADNHPVNLVPSKDKGINLNQEIFPLYVDRVKCMTCHDIKCLEEEKRNPKFFRGGPYKERIDACLMCHTKENYKAINPHEQFDDQGNFRMERCLYCHIMDLIYIK